MNKPENNVMVVGGGAGCGMETLAQSAARAMTPVFFLHSHDYRICRHYGSRGTGKTESQLEYFKRHAEAEKPKREAHRIKQERKAIFRLKQRDGKVKP